MRAAVCRFFGAPLRIEEAAIRPPGPGEVLVRIAACAVCHSDVAFIDGAWGGQLPAVYGHEAADIVEQAGADAGGLSAGGLSATISLGPVAIADRSLRAAGSKMGAARPRRDIPELADLYLAGRLKLDELISGRSGFDRINDAIDSARTGEQLRPVLVFGQ
ncbi:MAG: alcohol dehydrogenase catalytic domain-containing protein [Actinobacteria bacterium]|nr:alcohol dehydrogenase catalytic domain-containing protein [Actinomycetota bacterium]